MVDRIAPVCGTARTSSHNAVFLEGVRAALIADAAWMDGEYRAPPSRGLRALARVYAGWGFSQDFYNNEIYRQLGFTSALDCVTGFWETRYMKRDANNLLSMLRTWQLNDVGATRPLSWWFIPRFRPRPFPPERGPGRSSASADGASL
jgi:homoserine O-acetyltransferase